MGVLAVAEVFDLDQVEHEVVGEIVLLLREPGGDDRVVVGRVVEGLHGQPLARLQGYLTPVRLEFGQHGRVVGRVDDHAHPAEVLGRGAHHAGSADVDVLDGVFFLDPALGGDLLERVEVDHHQIDGFDAQFGDGLHVCGPAPISQDAAMDCRVKRLHPPVHDLREARHLRDAHDGQSALPQVRAVPPVETTSTPSSTRPRTNGSRSRLVRHRNQRALDLHSSSSALTFRRAISAHWRAHPPATRVPGMAALLAGRASGRRGRSLCSTSWMRRPRVSVRVPFLHAHRFLGDDRDRCRRPSSTKSTVTPVTFTPYSRASAMAVVPGKSGQQRGMQVDDPPGNACTKAGDSRRI